MNIDKKNILLISSIFIFPFTYFLFKLLTRHFGSRTGYLLGFVIYWIYCIFFIILFGRKKKEYLKGILKSPSSPKDKCFNFLAFLPVIGVFVISFLPNIRSIGFVTFVLVVVSAFMNGIIEEIYWRGLYLMEYKDNVWIGLIGSTLIFALWHVSLLRSEGIKFHGGAMALVGGALIMGLLWAFVSRKVNSIRYCILAHICVNFFAFTGLYVTNGFGII